MAEYLYSHLEQELKDLILKGQFRSGERMPSIRHLSKQRGIAKSTVLSAYDRLEADGLIEARPRSGYFVCTRHEFKTPEVSQPSIEPISANHLLLDVIQQGAAFDILPSCADCLPPDNNDPLKRALSRAQRRQTCREQQYYDDPTGRQDLKEQLVLHSQLSGIRCQPNDIVITSGCQHALLLALMATTQAGDVVAVESPGFYGALQLLQSLGLKVLELPCSSETGLSPEALELALQHWDIKAVVVSPAFATPTGACMPEENKKRLLELTADRGIAVIEDDIYGDLYFSLQRPTSLYSMDTSGNVILCSSFSKSVSRDLRLGWVIAKNHLEKIQRLKIATSISSSVTLQQGMCEFITEGGLAKTLKQKRQQLFLQYQQAKSLVSDYLPMALSCSQPQGGLTMWLELPKHINTLNLYNQGRDKGVLVTPGNLFSAQNKYENFLRFSFAHPWTEARVKGLEKLKGLIEEND